MHTSLLIISLLVVVALATESCGPGLPVPECGVFRHYDGSCNNPVNHNWGKAGNYLKRGAEGVRFDIVNGKRFPVLTPNMRTVSNDLFRADEAKIQEDGLNLLWTFFGQFVSHDLMGVNRKGDNGIDQLQPTNNTDVFITVPLNQTNDFFFSNNSALNLPIRVPYIRVLRSRGDVVNGVFQVGSESTSFLDLDTVYGKDAEVAHLLRKFSGGELVTRVYDNYKAVQKNGPGSIPGSFTTISPNYTGFYGEWLPLVADVDPNRTHIPISPQLVPAFVENIITRFFASGDPRNGENYGLNTFQGLFLREHNRIARAAAARNPTWTDEQLFQYARNLNIAQYQAIIMEEYLPATLNADMDLIEDYEGYDVWTDPQASQLFAFAFRFGHTTVPNAYSLKNQCGKPVFNSVRDGPRSSQAAGIFMPADQIAENERPEHVVHALLFNNAKAVDVQFPEQLRSIAFGANTDIVVQNQLRAADNGIPDYNTIRKLWSGLPRGSIYDVRSCSTAGGSETSPSPDPIECWNIINSNATVASTLRNLYGKVNNLNFYTAVVAEENTRSFGAVVGQTSARIIADQFKRTRDGDRFWYENESNGLFNRAQIREIKKIRMGDLLRDNFVGANVPVANQVPKRSVFYVPFPRFFTNSPPCRV